MSYVAFIPYRLVGAYLLMGWHLHGPLLGNHGRYSVLMEAM
jgi:hypothetical protein